MEAKTDLLCKVGAARNREYQHLSFRFSSIRVENKLAEIYLFFLRGCIFLVCAIYKVEDVHELLKRQQRLIRI